MEILQCFLTNNSCYKKNQKMTPQGIIVHSTGANNPYLKRYVQPDDGILGTNKYNNSWNRSGTNTCVHAFIGKDQNGEVRCYQTLPWNVCCWGIGRGSKGSYNYPASIKYPNDRPYIQFEMCEDALTDAAYFNAVMDKAQELCAYLLTEYPDIKLENVISHYEGYKRGMGSGHKDCDHWLAKFGKDMTWFRNCVAAKASGTSGTSEASTATETSVTYTVVKGDTLSKIGKQVGISWKVIANLNGIKFPYTIYPGQVLKLS